MVPEKVIRRAGATGARRPRSAVSTSCSTETSRLADARARCRAEIARRKQAERGLRTVEERVNELVEQSDDVLWLGEAGGRVLYVSPSYERIWARPVRTLYAEPEAWLEAVHADDRSRVRAAFHAAGNGCCDEDYRVVRPDGSIRWVHDRRFPVRDRDGVVSR